MTKRIKFILNKELINAEFNPNSTLLDFIRKAKHLVGTKEVCKEGDCGACSVLCGELVNDKIVYKTINSCIYPLGNCNNKHIVTIEGLNQTNLNLQQKAFAENGASQCGFCTPGFIIATTGYLINNDEYNLDSAIKSLDGNICRCTGYGSIKRALTNIIDELQNQTSESRNEFLISQNIIPDYFKDIPELLSKLNAESVQNTGATESVNFISGGTDLFVQQAEKLLESDSAFMIENKLSYIKQTEEQIHIGAYVTFEEFKQSQIIKNLFGNLDESMNLIASLPIRNTATIAGNIANASPIGDLTIILLALNASLVLSDSSNKRAVQLKEFYKGYKRLAKERNEFIEEIYFNIPHEKYKINFEKVSKRKYLDIASVNSAALFIYDDNKIITANISAGGVAPVPLLLKNTSDYFSDKIISQINFGEVKPILENEISPISDVRGSADYKKLLLFQLIKAHFVESFYEFISLEDLNK
jgi:xanthine dehydrogenase small subunit